MSAGDVAERRNHDADRQAVSERDAEKTEAARAMQILIRTDRARAEENQRKRSQEFRDQLLRCAVHSTLHARKGICARLDRLHSIWNAARSASLPAEIDQLCSGRPARRTRAENRGSLRNGMRAS